MDETELSTKVVSSDLAQPIKLVASADPDGTLARADETCGDTIEGTSAGKDLPYPQRSLWGTLLIFYTTNLHLALMMSLLEIIQREGAMGWFEIVKLNLLQPVALMANGGLTELLQSAGHYQGYFIALLLYAPLILLYPAIILFGSADGSIYTRLESQRDRVIEAVLVTIGLIAFIPPVFCQLIRALMDSSYAKRQQIDPSSVSFGAQVVIACYKLQVFNCIWFALLACFFPLKFTFDSWFFDSTWLLPTTILLWATIPYFKNRRIKTRLETEQQAK